MGKVVGLIAFVLLALALTFGCYALTGWILMLLWNWLVPALFQGPVLTFWQGVGIVFLLSLIGSILGLGRSKRS
jgi:hypothetical protein